MSQQQLQHEVIQLEQQLRLAKKKLMLSTAASQSPAAVSFTAPQQPGGLSISTSASPISQSSISPSNVRRHSAAPTRTAPSAGVQFRSVSPHACANSHEHPMKRAKTVNVHPAQIQHVRRLSGGNMGRSQSSQSTTPTTIPFKGSNAVTPPIPNPTQAPVQQADYSFPINFYSQDTQHQPASEMLLTHAMASTPAQVPQFQPSQQFQDIPGMPVEQFLMQNDSRNPSTLAASFAASQQHLSPTTAFQLPLNTPLASTCETLTDATTLGTPMSRQTSNQCHDHVPAMDNAIMNHCNSYGNQASLHINIAHSSRPHGKRGCEEEIIGIGQGLHDAMAHQLAASAVFEHAMTRAGSSESSSSGSSQASPFGSQLPRPESMVRSSSNISNSSAKSSQSLNLRAKDALTRHNKNATVSLAPKPVLIKAEPSLQAKTAITKEPYKRPHRPKVRCHQCDEHPNGFRGDHELRRHTLAKHQGLVRKWVCKDPNTMGIPTTLQAINALQKCKQCSAGKQYGAYYNAAAHLRRTHFKIKPARGSKASKSAGPGDEKHGGKSGGFWPPMSELKDVWVTGIMVAMDQPGALDGDNVDEQEVDVFDPAYYNAAGQLGVVAPLDMLPYAGVGDGLTMTQDALDFDADAFQAMDPVALAGYSDAGVLISSAGFFEADPQGLNMHSYASPVESSAPTLTQSTMYGHEQVYGGSPTTTIGNPMAVATDQPEFEFGMAFQQS